MPQIGLENPPKGEAVTNVPLTKKTFPCPGKPVSSHWAQGGRVTACRGCSVAGAPYATAELESSASTTQPHLSLGFEGHQERKWVGFAVFTPEKCPCPPGSHHLHLQFSGTCNIPTVQPGPQAQIWLETPLFVSWLQPVSDNRGLPGVMGHTAPSCPFKSIHKAHDPSVRRSLDCSRTSVYDSNLRSPFSRISQWWRVVFIQIKKNLFWEVIIPYREWRASVVWKLFNILIVEIWMKTLINILDCLPTRKKITNWGWTAGVYKVDLYRQCSKVGQI